MFRKTIVLMVTLSLVLLFTSACWAADRPFGVIKGPQDVIDKAFAGRTLDPIEGIWVKDPGRVVAIVKSPVIYPKDTPQKHDYYLIKIIGFSNVGEIGEAYDKTDYDFCFKSGKLNWKLLSPNLLENGGHDGGSNYYILPETYVRIYPAP